MCMECKHQPQDDFVCFAVDSHGKLKKSSKTVAGKWCANCGATYDNNLFCCVVTLQHKAGYQGWKVLSTFPP